MTFQRLKAMMDERPFKPFDIYTSDGEIVRVKSPEFAWIHPSKRTMFVATRADVDSEQVIDLLHITKLVTHGGGNGKRPSRFK